MFVQRQHALYFENGEIRDLIQRDQYFGVIKSLGRPLGLNLKGDVGVDGDNKMGYR